MRDYDDWKLDTPDNHLKVFCHCDQCGNEIYVGEEYLHLNNGDRIHDECFEYYVEETLEPDRRVANGQKESREA